MATMSTAMSTLRDRLQQTNYETSVNNEKLHEASQQFDVEVQRRVSDSEYNISRLKEEIRSEHAFQKRSDLELRMEVCKYRNEASKREAEN